MSAESKLLRMADAFGTPEHYATHVGEIEDAGGGNMRIFRCIIRAGLLVPVYSLITPAKSLMTDAQRALDAATKIHITWTDVGDAAFH